MAATRSRGKEMTTMSNQNEAKAILRSARISPQKARLVADQVRGLSAERAVNLRSEEHTSELQSLMRISYAVFCLKKKTSYAYTTNNPNNQRYCHNSSTPVNRHTTPT